MQKYKITKNKQYKMKKINNTNQEIQEIRNETLKYTNIKKLGNF